MVESPVIQSSINLGATLRYSAVVIQIQHYLALSRKMILEHLPWPQPIS